MKKIGLAVAILALLGASGIFLLKKKPVSNAGVEAPTAEAAATPVPELGKYLRSSRTGYREMLANDTRFPAECLDYFESLQKIDLFSALKGADSVKLTYQMLPLVPENCKGEYISGFNLVQQDYLKKCFPKDQNLSEDIDDACGSSIFMMRSAVTRLALKDKPISEITDLAQLTDMVFSELSGSFGEKGQPDFSKMKEISKRMLELDPNLYAAHKMNVMSNLIEGMIAKDQNQDASSMWEATEVALQKAKETRPNDPSLEDAVIAAQTHGLDPDLSYEMAQKMTQQNANNARGWFLLAYAQWKRGDHEGSIMNLKHAIALDPSNTDYQRNLQEILKPNATGDSFKGSLQIGIGNGDF